MHSSRIQLMDDTLINHIKAGEVIERPAAALKELLENSYDAGATEISVILEKSGLQFLQVTDNGNGICQHDLELAVSRHASSKLKALEDLNRILSMGFRGEALAAIAAISRFSLISRAVHADTAYQIAVAGGCIDPIQPVAHPEGTTVKVAELFYNTPARRKFLRSDRTEMLHVDAVIRRFALSAMSVTIKVLHNQKLIYHLPAANTPESVAKRLEKLLGSEFLQDAIMVDFAATQMQLSGWVNPARTHAVSRRALVQYLYLNGRPIQDRTIQHAIKLAYASSGFDETNCNYVLYLEVDPATVDVNVHPTKQEVRFLEKRLIHDLVTKGLMQALTSTPMSQPSHVLHENTDMKPEIEIYKKLETFNAKNFYQIPFPEYDEKNILTLRSSHHEDMEHHVRLDANPADAVDVATQQEKFNLGKIICVLPPEVFIVQPHETQHVIFLNVMHAQKFLMKLKMSDYNKNKEMRALLLPVVIPLEKKLPKVVLELFHAHGIFPEDFSAKKIIIRNSPLYLQSVSPELFFNRILHNDVLKKIMHDASDVLRIIEIIIECAVAALPKIDTLKQAETLLQLLSPYSEVILKREKIIQCLSLDELMSRIGLSAR